ncbi:MAG: glycine cleavage system aminomethyltransferase GcvT [Nitrospinae bacterium]|nr:glycine cleavage system aminomethyltransferase GcvT [Nitrospinota bacterium]
MSQESSTELKTTPFYNIHKELGAKLVPFAGWDMPIQYKGVIQEHLCVRNGVGIFDVSHMGEMDIRGKESKKLLQKLVTNDIEKMLDHSILYTVMCYEDGGVVDDLLVHRFSEDHYFLCVNAANSDKDFQWVRKIAAAYDVTVSDTSAETAQLAIQGKDSEQLLQRLCDVSLNDLRYYHFKKAKIHKNDCIISRTGYTGEDGFELYTDSSLAEPLFLKILEEGKSFNIQPIGLAARDTLRLEMGYALYGNDITAKTSPLEAGLGWVVKLQKEDFVGKESLNKQKEAGLKRKLVGIKLLQRGVLRPHYPVFAEGQPVGELTSGTFSPSLNMGIGLCYVSPEHSQVGTRLAVGIRNQQVPAEIVKPPFVPPGVKH